MLTARLDNLEAYNTARILARNFGSRSSPCFFLALKDPVSSRRRPAIRRIKAVCDAGTKTVSPELLMGHLGGQRRRGGGAASRGKGCPRNFGRVCVCE